MDKAPFPETHDSLIARANASVEQARARLDPDDPHRPRFHFLPPANWMNDPNGFIQWKGRYHLFYQHNPYGPLWGNMHWGHAVSRDLVQWEHLPIAIAPMPGTADKDGIFSGCVVDHAGVPTAVYTGVRPECQCLATSRDDLVTWQKHPANPVVAAAPEGFNAGFRDPWVWREGDEWLMIVGSGRNAAAGGALLLYRSSDLVHWEYLHPLFEGEARESGRMWECPFFFPLGEKHVLLASPYPLGRSIWFSGRYVNRRFIPETQGPVDFAHGDSYATHVLRDDRGRWIMVAWLREARPGAAQSAAGWSGALSLPRVLSLTPDGRLAQHPLPELQQLRRRHFHAGQVDLTREVPELRSDVTGDALEIAARLNPRLAECLGLKLRRSPDGEEETRIAFDPWAGTLTIDRSRSSLDRSVNLSPQVAPLRLKPGEPLELRVFVDRSIVEVFANGGISLTARLYPTRRDATEVRVWGVDGATRVESLDVWEMGAIV